MLSNSDVKITFNYKDSPTPSAQITQPTKGENKPKNNDRSVTKCITHSFTSMEQLVIPPIANSYVQKE
jgi:hypothetical protein